MTGLSVAEQDALAKWLDHLRALDGAAANTITAYASDVRRFLQFLTQHLSLIHISEPTRPY